MENKYTVLPRYTATFWTREIFGGTTSEHSYAWTHELAMNLLNRKDDGYKGMLNLCTYVNVLFDNKYKKSIKTNFTELILFTMPIQVELNFTVSE